MRIVVTGGTGFMGSLLVRDLLKNDYHTVVTVSRRWEGSQALRNSIPEEHRRRLRTINADVCDTDELNRIFNGVDIVYHAAAYKSLVDGLYSPFEITRVNINGSKSVISAAIENNVKKVVAISTDKAAEPSNLYGCTKAVMEHMFISANYMGKTNFAVARYGNVFGSTGSVIPVWKQSFRENEKITINNPDATRFWFHPSSAVSFLRFVMEKSVGGEIHIPSLRSSTIAELAEQFLIYKGVSRNAFRDYIIHSRMNSGEKLHESMISVQEARNMHLRYTQRGIVLSPLLQRSGDDPDEPASIYAAYSSNGSKRCKADELQRMFHDVE